VTTFLELAAKQLEHGFIGGVMGKGFAQKCDLVGRLFEQVAQVFG